MKPSLARRMYLLCWDKDKHRLETNSSLVHGPLLRAAAVADLTIDGLLRDRGGKAERVGGAASPPDDDFLSKVLDDVPPDRPRRWFTVVDRDWHTAERSVRDGLAATGDIEISRRRALGLFPVRRVAVSDHEGLATLRDRVRSTVLDGHAPADVAIEDATLAAFAIDGDVRIVFTPAERRAHKTSCRAVTDHVDTVLPGIRKALVWSIVARRTPPSSS
ncbi:GPP34 family phosphoprotein [Amycolatopsis antarctica]|uniref:GPP34 family phosphoprotein n=1 Tax=Amycolatopsis antarctica TaxID=1854586 RepID=A0A263D0Q4_9PSEU|nr:GPP34 family phosphoprotein [Amycolatopsis antarctica]OZM71106.1 GPP34 family phosphoprotein [Amycolatopsis antarctica]